MRLFHLSLDPVLRRKDAVEKYSAGKCRRRETSKDSGRGSRANDPSSERTERPSGESLEGYALGKRLGTDTGLVHKDWKKSMKAFLLLLLGVNRSVQSRVIFLSDYVLLLLHF